MPDPMIVTPGQIVAPPDWDALNQQHGGIKSSTMIPLTDPRVQALIQANPDLASTLQQHPIYRYYMGDGSFVEAYGQENGQDVQIVDYKPSAKFTQQQTQATQQAAGSTGSNPRVPPGSTPAIEGTPVRQADGSTTFDNSQPIRAWHTPDGKVIYEPLTPQERQDWEKQKNGGLTDEQVRAQQQTATVRVPDKEHPGLTIVTTKDGTGNQATHYEDASGQTVATPPDAPVVSSRVEQRNGRAYTVVTSTPKTGGTPSLTVLGPDGQVVPGGLPDEGPKEATTTVTRNGKTFIQHTVAKPDGGADTYFTDQNGQRTTLPDEVKPGDYQPLPAGVPEYKPNLALGDGGIIARKRQLDQLVQAGTITKDQAAAEITLNAETLKASAAQLGSAVQVQENNRANQTTQRGQDLSEEQSRRNFSQGTYANVLSGVLPIATRLGGGANAGEIGARGLLAMLALGTANAQANGGLSATPTPQVQGGPLLNQQGQAALDATGQIVMPPGPGAASVLTPQSAAASTEAVQQQQAAQQAPQPSAAPTTTIAPDGTVTVQHTAPDPIFKPQPPVGGGFMQSTDWNGGPGAAGVLNPQAQPPAAWHPNADGTHDMLVAAGLDPAIVGAEAQRALGPSGSSMG